MACAFAMIMAGADNADLSVLTEVRSEPAVPFAGKFRLIDFSLSNCVNSTIHNVAVLTQYRPRSLNDHIGIGKPWDLDRSSGGVRLLQPYRGGPYGDWQRGSRRHSAQPGLCTPAEGGVRTDPLRQTYLSDGLPALSCPSSAHRRTGDHRCPPREPAMKPIVSASFRWTRTAASSSFKRSRGVRCRISPAWASMCSSATFW